MLRALACAAALALLPAPALAQNNLERYERLGEELWTRKQGPNNASLEQCDIGMGPGRLKGASARLPRYFKDTGAVMDLESRLVHCMITLQGRGREDILQRPFGNADKPSELEYLSMYIARQSNGSKIDPGTSHPREKESYALGERLFTWRTGLWDFSCRSCHGEEGERIRASTSSPVTLQGRINQCFRRMRAAEPVFGSQAVNALIHYLTVKSKGARYNGPGIAEPSAREVQDILKRDFRPRGQAKMDRMEQDAVQRVCTETNNSPPSDLARKLEADQMKTIDFPTGSLAGSWEEGARIAKQPGGGGCYDCHEISRGHEAFGTLGPSLRRFGWMRGSGPEMQRYVYGKIYNAKAYDLCSEMPRFGHTGSLSEQQIKDLTAYLLDPESPVNKQGN